MCLSRNVGIINCRNIDSYEFIRYERDFYLVQRSSAKMIRRKRGKTIIAGKALEKLSNFRVSI